MIDQEIKNKGLRREFKELRFLKMKAKICKNCKHYNTGEVDDQKRALCFKHKEYTKANESCDYFEKSKGVKDCISFIKDNKVDCHAVAKYLLKNYKIITISDTKEIYLFIDGVYLSREHFLLSKIQRTLNKSCKIHYTNEILGHIKRMTFRDREALKEPADKICLENGILNLETLKIIPHNHKIIFFNKLPVKYDPNADCPKIKKFLKQIVKKDDVTLLQEFAGYCLLKNYRIHKAFMLVGSGANGKSTFLNLLKNMLGAENVTSIPLQSLETNRFAISALYGKLANIFADLSNKSLTGTSIFKMLVGQDQIPAERKFKDQFFFTNYAKLIFSANQIPKSHEDTDAFFRRWVIINFPNQFMNNADKTLIDKLTTSEELSGFLNFAIEGLRRVMENSDFSNTDSVIETRDKYVRMSDSIGAFELDEILISPEDYIPKDELYTHYCEYCRDNSYPAEASNTFHKELQKKIRIADYRPSIDQRRVQCWKGITLKRKNNPDILDNPDTKKIDVKGVKDVKGNSILKVHIDEEKIE